MKRIVENICWLGRYVHEGIWCFFYEHFNKEGRETKRMQKEFDKEFKEFNKLMEIAEEVSDMSKPLKHYKELD